MMNNMQHTRTKNVLFYHHKILTTITKDPISVTSWISETTRNIKPNHPLIIGLDTEWRASFTRGVESTVAIIQLCSGNRCLIFQIIHARDIPQSLFDFLNNPNYTFTGVGIIQEDAKKLVNQYGLGGVDDGQRLGGNMVELGQVAAEMYGNHMRGLGLKALAKKFIGLEPEKPKRVTLSRWDNYRLSPEQIDYACIDAFCSFEIGRVLFSMRGY